MGKVTPIGEIIEQMDAGLDRAVLSVLRKRIGAESSISKPELLFALRQHGFGVRLSDDTFERQVRRCIVDMRKRPPQDERNPKDVLIICSDSGGGGYYIAKDANEADEFIEREYNGRINDLVETRDALSTAARVRWGTGVQMGLF